MEVTFLLSALVKSAMIKMATNGMKNAACEYDLCSLSYNNELKLIFKVTFWVLDIDLTV